MHSVLKALGVREQQAAPVEDRNTQSSTSVAEAARAPVRPAQTAVTAAEPRTPVPMAPPPSAQAAVTAAEPRTPVPMPVPIASPPLWTPPVTPAPAPSWTPPVTPAPAPSLTPAPRAPPPAPMLASLSTAVEADDAQGVRGRRMLSDAVPRIAVQARADASTVLWMAASADHPAQSAGVVNAAHGAWNSEQLYLPGPRDTVRARRLYEEAKWVFASGRTSDALDLGVRAFAFDPRDSNIAGFLAVVHLSMRPPQPETARQLALHALALSGSVGARDVSRGLSPGPGRLGHVRDCQRAYGQGGGCHAGVSGGACRDAGPRPQLRYRPACVRDVRGASSCPGTGNAGPHPRPAP